MEFYLSYFTLEKLLYHQFRISAVVVFVTVGGAPVAPSTWPYWKMKEVL